MHEMSLLRDVVDIVVDQTKDSDIKRVTKVVLAVGEMRDIVDEYVPGLFSRLTRDTIAEGSSIEVMYVPVMARCEKCGYVLPVDWRDESTWECPNCGTYKQFHLISGNEFMVKSIEVEMCQN